MPAFLRRLRILLNAAVVLGLLLAMGWVYEQAAWYLAAWKEPEAGRPVDIGGRRLQIYCTGQGTPTVVLESGLGDLLEQWRRVQTEVSSSLRTCSYDRAGYGTSDEGPLPRTAERIASDLHALLEQAGEKPPYVLVGHSFGGFAVRVFHGKYPSEVRGMVLVDATQEDQYEELPAAWQALRAVEEKRYQAQARWAPLEVGFGIKRLELLWRGVAVPNRLLQEKYFRARASELTNIQVSAEQAQAAGGLGAKPLFVLTGGKPELLEGLSAEENAAFREVWVNELQERLVSLSTRGQWKVLPDSGHDIPADRPDAIVDAIREVAGKR